MKQIPDEAPLLVASQWAAVLVHQDADAALR